MQIRDFISHEWQTIGSIQVALTDAGIPVPEVALRRLLENMPCILVNGNMVRQTVPAEEVSK